MADVDGPRLATPAELEDISRATDRFFNFEAGGYRARWPQCFDDAEPLPHAIVKRDGRVVSHVAAIPQTLVVGDCRVECRGISGVGTLPAYQGEGYMSALLEFWLDRMRAGDVPLSDLGGDRRRYNRFGWELAGRECFYDVTPRSFPDEPTVTRHVRQYDRTAADREFIRRLHERENLRVARSEEDYATLFAKRGVETLLFEGDPAYLSFTRESTERTVTEFGGSPAGVEALLGHLLAAYRTESITVRAHPDHPLASLLRRVSSGWRSVPHRMVNVLDLRATLDAFAPRLAEQWRGRDSTGTVTIGVEGGEAIRVAYGPDAVTVESFEGTPDVELDRLAMTRLLFGVPGGVHPAADTDPFLATALPLDFYVWRTDAV